MCNNNTKSKASKNRKKPKINRQTRKKHSNNVAVGQQERDVFIDTVRCVNCSARCLCVILNGCKTIANKRVEKN